MGEVYDAYLPKLRGLLGRGFVVRSTGLLVPGIDDADELAAAINQVFMRALDRPARLGYDGQRDYWPYLATLARNVLVSQHRKYGRELPASDRESYEDAEVIDGTREVEVAQDRVDPAAHEILQGYLASLPERQRALHTARYVNDLTPEDTAAQLGVSRTRVRQLEGRMLRELYRLLQRITPTPGSSHG